MRVLLAGVLDALLPPACPGCGAASAAEQREPLALCSGCAALLQRRPPVGCRRCGEPVLAAGESCGDDHRALRGLSRHVAPFRYAGTGGVLVRRLKLDGEAGAGRFLARAMALAWTPWAAAAGRRALLVPVPLHRQRRRERGFDQAAWLAARIGRKLGLEVADAVLARQRSTLPQGDPRVLSRSGNVEGVFAVARPGCVAGRPVVLVDDVFTSGATARACATALMVAGAGEVAVLTACRS